MPGRLSDIVAGRLGRMLLVLAAAFAGMALALTPAHLILLLNGLSLSVSAGVSTAYLPIAGGALHRAAPTRGDVLGAGIFLAGLSEVTIRAQSIIARDLGHPAILNSDLAACSIFLGVLSLAAFLWAPHADDGLVPREKWRMAGLLVAAGVAIALAAGAAQHGVAPAPLVRLE